MRTPASDLATRQAYDAVARDYARLLPDMSPEAPLDRAVLSAFAEMLPGDSRALVAEVGCGTGRVAKHLSDLGVRVFGLDLSPAMAAIAQASYSHVPFAAAHAAALPLRAAVLDGLVAWYSLINLPTTALPAVFAEFARATATGAPVLVAFQSGDGQRIDSAQSYGQAVPLTYYRHRTSEVVSALEAAGFEIYAEVSRAAGATFESTPQAALLAHREERL